MLGGVIAVAGAGAAQPAEDRAVPVLTVSRAGVLLRGGKPWRGIGVNYFDAFARTLKNPEDTSYEAGFETLEEHGIPFARFMACGYWPVEWRLYQTDRDAYFRRLDRVVKSAEKRGIGLIPSLFWHFPTVPDLVGETVNQWGNPQSKTIAFMRQYTREMVRRYRASPAIWGWEFGNEFNLAADLPNAAEHRPPIVPDLGTPKTRSAQDEITHDVMRTALREFAREVRRHDKRRPIFSGNAFPRPSAWHQKAELSWKQDTPEQYAEMLLGDNPDPMDTLTVHLYPDDEKRFGRTVPFLQLLRVSLEAGRKAGKALFVGEFGVGQTTGEEAVQQRFTEMLDAIVESGTPLAALWVFDYAGQDDTWSVTATNRRAYQLKALQESNRQLGRAFTTSRHARSPSPAAARPRRRP